MRQTGIGWLAAAVLASLLGAGSTSAAAPPASGLVVDLQRFFEPPQPFQIDADLERSARVFDLLLLPGLEAAEVVIEDAREIKTKEYMLIDESPPLKNGAYPAYLFAVKSLQALGKERACMILTELADREAWQDVRTFTLCRMLFKANPTKCFRRPYGGMGLFDRRESGSLFGAEFFTGQPELPSEYVRYCIEECDWIGTQSQDEVPVGRELPRREAE